EALRRYTVGSAWFSGEEAQKGAVAPGQLADLAVLSADYFAVPEEEIKGIESVLTVGGGKVVDAAAEVASLGPPPLPVLPDWSPVAAYGGYYQPGSGPRPTAGCGHPGHTILGALLGLTCGFWGTGCDCFVF